MEWAGMLDIKLIREDPGRVRRNLERRHEPEKLKLLDGLIEDDARWRELTTRANELRRRRNEISSEIAKAMREGGDPSPLKEEAAEIPDRIVQVENERDLYQSRVQDALMRLPNLLHESVPYGIDDSENVEVRR